MTCQFDSDLGHHIMEGMALMTLYEIREFATSLVTHPEKEVRELAMMAIRLCKNLELLTKRIDNIELQLKNREDKLTH